MKKVWNWLISRIALIIITIGSLIFAIIAGIICQNMITPIYKADTSIIIYAPDNTVPLLAIPTNYNNIMMFQQLVKTYSEIAKSKAVAQDVITTLGLSISVEDLQSMILVSPKANTQELDIFVESTNSVESAAIANQVRLSLANVSANIFQYNFVNTLDVAYPPTHPDSPKIIYIVAISFIASFIILSLELYS